MPEASSASGQPHGYEFGPFRLDARGGAVYRGGERLALPPKAVDVLRLLLEASGELVPRQDLMSGVWPDVVVEESNLSKLIHILRHELADVPEYAEAIQTVPKRGYRFVGRFHEYRGERQEPTGSLDRDEALSDGESGTLVAVLPLRMLTSSADDAFLSVALADALINRLVGLSHLRVRPTNAVTMLAREQLEPAIAAQRLGVQVVVEGSVQRSGSRVRVHLQVWGQSGRTSIKSLREESDLSNLFPLEDRLAAGLVDLFRHPTETDEKRVAPKIDGPKNPVAYGQYLRAVECILRYDPLEAKQAVALLERVTALEPEFANGWARLSAAALIVGTLFDPEDHWTKYAEDAARRALALKPGDADAHCALARTLWTPANGFQHRGALASFSDALRLNPNCQQALTWYGGVLSHIGLLAEAKEYLLEALAISPYDGAALGMLGQNGIYENQLEEAAEVYERALKQNPSEFQALIQRPGVSLYAGNLERAEREIKAARDLGAGPGQPIPDGHEALLWALRGENSRASTFIAKTLEGTVMLTTHHAWHYAAAAAAVMNEPDRAMDLLELATGMGLQSYPAFKNDRFLARLEGQPRYQRWLGQLEADWLEYRRDFAAGP
jgi:DNA-binding winged helix-turn-helix (wHTH) protein/tetratricopeptide (TPR) repeat protein